MPKGFNIHQEVELGVIIGKNGKNIKENDALDYVGGYCLALDMTEADLMVMCNCQSLFCLEISYIFHYFIYLYIKMLSMANFRQRAEKRVYHGA